jgi:hypothetical protein
MSSLDALHDWHDFFVVIGAASGGLLGAMFVVASIGSGFLTKKHATATRVFLTPTVIHMATVMFGCALAVAPSLERVSFGFVFGLGGAGTASGRRHTQRMGHDPVFRPECAPLELNRKIMTRC